jgi:hypothetical protein
MKGRGNMLKAVSIVLVLGTFCASAGGAEVTGVELLDHCTTAIRVTEQHSGSTSEYYDGAFCLAYVLGFADGLKMGSVVNTVKSNTRTPTTSGGNVGVCEPDHVSNEQLIRVVLKYLQQHPESLHEPAGFLVWTALHEAFPCKN